MFPEMAAVVLLELRFWQPALQYRTGNITSLNALRGFRKQESSIVLIRSFEKGLAGRGGWREEILQRPEIQASFL